MLLSSLRASFVEAFGTSPTAFSVAPGRVNLIGEHIDYLGGCVLPAAIDRQIRIACRPNGTDDVRIQSDHSGASPVSFPVTDDRVREGDESWINYPLGVLGEYRKDGVTCPGFDALISSNLPAGAGLSSSAALEAATALIVEWLSGEARSAAQRAALCRLAEHHYAGVPCGIMDQLVVCAAEEGHALRIDCETLETRPVGLPRGIVLVIANTGVQHALGDGEYRIRREQCAEAEQILGVASLCQASLEEIGKQESQLGELLTRRARHAVTELERVEDFILAMAANDSATTRRIMHEGHVSLRDDFEVSCPELDCLVEAAEEFGHGLWGARMTGGGFGGSTVNLIEAKQVAAFTAFLSEHFYVTFERKPDIFTAHPSPGAQIFPASAGDA